MKETFICEYIWLDKWKKLRSKTKVLYHWDFEDKGMPMWNYDGSSTGQADGKDSEIFLKPVKIVPDPFGNTQTHFSFYVIIGLSIKIILNKITLFIYHTKYRISYPSIIQK